LQLQRSLDIAFHIENRAITVLEVRVKKSRHEIHFEFVRKLIGAVKLHACF